jgi:hypothetical protein
VLWPVDEKSWASIRESEWDYERALAARRRLVGSPGPLVQAGSRVVRVIEHAYYIAHYQLLSRHPEEVVIDPGLDEEMERLFALLAPTGEVLHVERVTRLVDLGAEEEICYGRCD